MSMSSLVVSLQTTGQEAYHGMDETLEMNEGYSLNMYNCKIAKYLELQSRGFRLFLVLCSDFLTIF
jgi:hypothetical protein